MDEVYFRDIINNLIVNITRNVITPGQQTNEITRIAADNSDRIAADNSERIAP